MNSDQIKRLASIIAKVGDEASQEILQFVADLLAQQESIPDSRLYERERKRARREECNNKEWRALRSLVFRRDNFICAYCGEGTTEPHCDHVIPFSKGGRSTVENLVTACPTCNIRKGAQIWE